MITGLHSCVLFCTDTEASKAWYERCGFKFLRGYEGMYWFALGEAEVMLHPSKNGPSGHLPELHLAVSDLDFVFSQVQERGLVPGDHQGDGSPLREPVLRPWGVRAFELTDPAGHRWAFTQAAEGP